MQEHEIVSKVLTAKSDTKAADKLIEQYLPFIKSETAKFIGRNPDSGDDELSIAMFAFYEAIINYKQSKGAFLKLAALSIKNRLIDYRRKQARHEGHLSLETPVEHGDNLTVGDRIADETSNPQITHAQMDAKAEIDHFTATLKEYGLSLSDIADNCPKQERTLKACMKVLEFSRQNPDIFTQLEITKKLPLTLIANGTKVDKKTLERHRKYIVAILVAYTNGFEIIRGHLQSVKKKEVNLT